MNFAVYHFLLSAFSKIIIFDKKSITMKNKLRITAAILCSLTFFSMSAQTVDEIVTKHIEAIGGKDNWLKVKSLRLEISMKAQGAEIKLVRTQIDKKDMRMDISVMGMNGYSILTPTEGWNFYPFQGQTKPEPMTADDIKTSQDQLQLHDDFITYKDLGKKLEFIGKDDVDGTECLKLKMTDKDGQETTYFLDPENYYIIKQITKIKADGKEVEDVTSFSNYKKVPEGIVYAMSVAGGFGDMEVTKLEINPKIDESIFKPTL